MRSGLLGQLSAGIRIVVVMTIALGVVYPLAVTAFAQVAVGDRANGQLVRVDGEVVGSSLIGQEFTEPQYFHSRPSAAGYDAAASTGSNLGPTNPELLDTVAERVVTYREVNGFARRCRRSRRRRHELGVGTRSAHLVGERSAPGPTGRRGTGARPRCRHRPDR